MPELDGKKYEYTAAGTEQYKEDKNRLEKASGGLIALVKKALQARKRAEREEDYDALADSIPAQEDKIADRILEIAEKDKKYAKKASKIFSSPSTPESYVVPDEVYNRREELKNKSLLSTGTVGPLGLIFGALGRKGLKMDTLPESEYNRIRNMVGSISDEVNKEIEMDRRGYQEGGELDAQMTEMMKEPTHTMPDGTEMTGASHEDYEEIMAEEPLVPDEEMEDDYIDFVINESLSQEDEDYLLEKLSADDRLSTIFDRVVETASEFAGSGPVEGPGTERSDSIPARLSDGEFVVTSKAANKIGPDNLQGMMEQAELESDMDEVKRQIKQAGGVVEEEEQEEVVVDSTISGNKSVVMPASITDRKIKESMLSLNPRNSLFTS